MCQTGLRWNSNKILISILLIQITYGYGNKENQLTKLEKWIKLSDSSDCRVILRQFSAQKEFKNKF